jgi:hypothetical protein
MLETTPMRQPILNRISPSRFDKNGLQLAI